MKSEVSAWDSSRSAAKLILGLFLIVGLFSFTKFGVMQLLFLKNNNHTDPPVKINLQETPDANFGKGYYQVQGFLGRPIEYVYYGGDTGAITFYYYPMFSSVERTEAKLLIRDDRTPPSLEEIEPTLITVQGTIGIETLPSEVQKKFENPLPLLKVASATPKLSTVLSWFILVSIGFFVGVSLVLKWLYKVKKQVL